MVNKKSDILINDTILACAFCYDRAKYLLWTLPRWIRLHNDQCILYIIMSQHPLCLKRVTVFFLPMCMCIVLLVLLPWYLYKFAVQYSSKSKIARFAYQNYEIENLNIRAWQHDCCCNRLLTCYYKRNFMFYYIWMFHIE